MTSCILKMLHFPFSFFLSSFLSYMCAYAISFLFLFGGAICTHLCIFLCVCIIKRPIAVGIQKEASRKKKKKKEKVVRKTQRNGRWNTRQTRDIYLRMMARACLYCCCYATKTTLPVYTLHLHSHRLGRRWENKISSAFDYCTSTSSRLSQPMASWTFIFIPLTEHVTQQFVHYVTTFICPVKMLTHKVHTVKFLSAIIWSPGKYIWRFGLAINNYKCVSLHICNWQPDREREESFKKKIIIIIQMSWYGARKAIITKRHFFNDTTS